MEVTHDDPLNLFTEPPRQNTILKTETLLLRPLSNITAGNTIKFQHWSDNEHFIDLSAIRLRAVFQMEPQPTQKDEILCGVVDKFMVAFFKESLVKLNRDRVGDASIHYAISNAVRIPMNFGNEVDQGWLATLPYMQNTPGKAGEPVTADAKGKLIFPNKALLRRATLFLNKNVEFSSPFFSDVTSTNRFLVPGVDIYIELTRVSDDFLLVSVPDNGGKIKIKVKDLILEIPLITINPKIAQAIESKLKTHAAVYPYILTKMVQQLVTQGVSNALISNICPVSHLPSKIYAVFISETAYSGNIVEDPFFFHHYNLQSAEMILDENNRIFGQPLQCDFDPNDDENLNASVFDHIQRHAGFSYKNTRNAVTVGALQNGLCILVWDLRPYKTDTFSLKRQGNLYAKFRFKTPLKRNIFITLITETESVFRVTKDRLIENEFDD